ncbi:MAG: hypothetical protein D3910_01610 [Candidatus Electrothrix sp. ATG2]|nr:hypothetical protein [Candidatus Electrothrix sp. ATG2]
MSLFFVSACSKKQITTVLEDISRDTYEKKAREQRIENFGNVAYEEPPSYDQYQRERKEATSSGEVPLKSGDKDSYEIYLKRDMQSREGL